MPRRLVELKKQNQTMIWNSASAEIVDDTECFVWQDNNVVLGMTTAYSIKETTPRLRKRPALTSTNARIVRPVFDDALRKWLDIALAIDTYNHGMNSVDRANQLRRNYTIHRPQIYRVWHPIWYWLMDISATNAYLMTTSPEEDQQHRAHRKFQENLTMQLLEVTQDGPEQVAEQVQASPQAVPRWRSIVRPSYCVWCLAHKETAAPRAKRRKVLAEDPNAANQRSKPYVPQSRAACGCHGKPLCRKSDCWDRYHASLDQS
jgi:hypothetical protein